MFKTIIPATDWFYVDYGNEAEPAKLPVVFRLAAWGLTEKGAIIGLISASDPMGIDAESRCVQLASIPPSNTGSYKHKDDLTDVELTHLSPLRSIYA